MLRDAREWLRQAKTGRLPNTPRKKRPKPTAALPEPHHHTVPITGKAKIYTDGACISNPGPGGYAVVLLHEDRRLELSGGFRLTTNNRMELLACIIGLRNLRIRRPAIVYSDSRYVVDGISKGWAARWRADGWMRTEVARAENADLWAQLLALLDADDVEFRWVRGHAGNRENARCDHLARAAAVRQDLPPDTAYEAGETRPA